MNINKREEKGARGKSGFGVIEYLIALRPGALQLIPPVKLQLKLSSCFQRKFHSPFKERHILILNFAAHNIEHFLQNTEPKCI